MNQWNSPSGHAVNSLKEKHNKKRAKKLKETVAMLGWFAVERQRSEEWYSIFPPPALSKQKTQLS